MNKIFEFSEKYGFALVVLFCFGFFTPDLSPKQGLMHDDSYASSGSGPKSNIVKQVFWISLFLFFSWRSVVNNILTKKQFNQLVCVLLLCTLAMISSTWSNFPLLSLKRAIFQFIFCFTVISSFYYAIKHNTLGDILLYSGILIILMLMLAILLGTGFSNSGTLTGFSPGKNVLGQNLLVYLVFITLYLKTNEKIDSKLHWLSVLFFLFLVMTASKTSILLFLLFLFIGYLIPKFSRYLNATSFILFCSVFVFIPCLSFYMGDIIHIGQHISPEAITGRGLIWNMLYIDLSFFNKISLGYGYGTYFNTGVTPEMFDDSWSFLSRITSTHNGYINMLMQFGFYGCLVIFVFLLFLYRQIQNHWLITALFVAVIYNFTEASFFRDHTMMWLMVLVVFTYIPTHFNRINNA